MSGKIKRQGCGNKEKAARQWGGHGVVKQEQAEVEVLFLLLLFVELRLRGE